jgi:putative transposase
LQTNRYINNYLEKRVFGVKEKEVNEICLSRFVEVINFCIMPNHFHITVKSTTEEGISRYMHRVANAYAKYFNKKYSKSGHVFQGTYKAKFISSDSQLVYLSAYVHRNPHDLEMWKNNSINYPWSSYQDYERNRWGRLLLPAEITESFRNHGDYRDYVESSGAKDKWEDEYGGTVDFI